VAQAAAAAMSVVPRRLSRLSSHVSSSIAAVGRGGSGNNGGGGRRAFAAATAQQPELYFGTMTFGWNQASKTVDDQVASSMLQRFLSSGGVQVDTARIYSGGDTEDILGRVLQQPQIRDHSYVLGTKAHPSQPGGLSKAGIRGQLENSLKALKVDKVDVLYLHQPDPEHDLAESLECVQELISEGAVAKYGMSNYSALEVDRCCNLCKERGWTTPNFFQALYNPLNRWTEEELLPVLRKHNVAFIAYNPLAAGLLSGKHSVEGTVLAGRFKDNPNYLPRFYTEPNFMAVERIRAACAEHSLGMVPATYAWLLRHSALDASCGDGVLLGASSEDQLAENLTSCLSPPSLPPAVVTAFDKAWETCKDGAFPYWRSYSKDQPGRETLHPGASYDAAKKK